MFRRTKSLLPVILRNFNPPKANRQAILPLIQAKPSLRTNRAFLTTLTAKQPELVETTTTPPAATAEEAQKETELGSTKAEEIALWDKYCNRLKEKDHLTAEDFEDICKVTYYSNHLEHEEVISRIQSILREIHVRKGERNMEQIFTKCCNMLMSMFVRESDMKSALLVMEGLINAGQHNEVSIRTIVTGLGRHGSKADVHKFIKSLEQRGLLLDSADVYCSLLRTLKRFGDVAGCNYLFSKMESKDLTDQTSYKIMMELYRNERQPEAAFRMFEQMGAKGIERDIPTYTILFSALSKDGRNQDMMKKMFDHLKQSGAPLSAGIYLAMKWDPLEALEDMRKSNIERNIRDYNTCLAYYVRHNRFSEALKVFKLMDKNQAPMDSYSYSILIDALARDIETPVEAVFSVYEEMKMRNIKPDVVLYTSLMSACNRTQDLDKALSLLKEMPTYRVKPNLYTFNSILSIMSNMAGTSTIDLDRASLLWNKMASLGIEPDTRTFNIYLSIISKLIKPVEPTAISSSSSLWEEESEDTESRVPRTVEEMQRMYRYMRRNNHESMKPDFVSYTIIINALSAAGQLRSALQVYGDAKMSRVTLPVSAYNELMGALQRGGKISEAMNLWHDMKLSGVLPDNTTYNIVLENCEQLGLTESIKNIRNQRKLDFSRLVELDRKKEQRLLSKKRNYNRN